MNCGAATAFLPNFVGFPSLRGLHSSTVQLWRAPRRAMVRPGAHREARGRVHASAVPARRDRGPAVAGPALRMRLPPRGAQLPRVSCLRRIRRLPRRRTRLRRTSRLRRSGPAAGVAPVVPTVTPARRSRRLPRRPTSCRLRPRCRDAPRDATAGPDFAARRTARRAEPPRTRSTTTARMKPMNMASPSFRSPEATPRGRLALACQGDALAA